MLKKQRSLVASRATDALHQVTVPSSIANHQRSMILINHAHTWAKNSSDKIVEANTPIREFADEFRKVTGLTKDQSLCHVVDITTKVDPPSGAALYSSPEHYIRGKGAKMEVTARGPDGKATACQVRAIKLTPKMKIHILASGQTQLARDLREFMMACVKRLDDLKQECNEYLTAHEEETALAKLVRENTIDILTQKGMDADDAKGIILSLDKEVTLPCLLGTVKDQVTDQRDDHGAHHGVASVKTATKALKTVAAMPGAVTSISKGRGVSSGLNMTGRIEQAFVRNRVRVAFQREPGTINKPRARAIMRQVAHRYKDHCLEYDNNDDETLLSAEEQAQAKMDSAQDMRLGFTPQTTAPATPQWRAQHGLL